MQFSYQGFTWDSRPLRGEEVAPTRVQALAALASVPPLGQRAKAFSEAWAAYECGDYAHAVSCAEHACDWAEGWEMGCRS